MSEMRDDVARAIDPVPWHSGYDEPWIHFTPDEHQAFLRQLRGPSLEKADAAIAAATPYIEAALLSRLAEKAELEKWYCVSPDTQPSELADWLRAQGGQE